MNILNEIYPLKTRKQALKEYDQLLDELFSQQTYRDKVKILQGIGWDIAIDGETRTPTEIWKKEDRKSKIEALKKFGFDLKEL